MKIASCNREKKDYIEDGIKLLELAKYANANYLTEDAWERREILDLIYSNCTLKGGKVEVELSEVFRILADGVKLEEALEGSTRAKIAVNQIWLPMRNPLHKLSQFLG